MQSQWNIYHALGECKYKAWLLDRHEAKDVLVPTDIIPKTATLPIQLSGYKPIAKDRIAATALAMDAAISNGCTLKRIEVCYTPNAKDTFPISRYARQANDMRNEMARLSSALEPPSFFKNKYCAECQFKDACYQKLKEKDCLSLLGGITEKTIAKYHGRGIFTVTQLSHLFRPRRRGRRPHPTGNFLWELKALALREHKTFVIHPPELEDTPVSLFIDFEGLPDDSNYLLGVMVRKESADAEHFQFWADSKGDGKRMFAGFIELVQSYPDAPVYHFGSYETKALNHLNKMYGKHTKRFLADLAGRMVNLLSYFRTHVYPPTYGNGLKEIARHIGFEWTDKGASGLKSIEWRREWETTRGQLWKDKLLLYNREDCEALLCIYQWFRQLASGQGDDTKMVSDMKRQSPYKFRNNPEYSEDFQTINKAAYFDYQRTRIYFRDQGNRPSVIGLKNHQLFHPGKGIVAWKPKTINEIVEGRPLSKCPKCGHRRMYQLPTTTFSAIQTDLKFTATGIKRWVVEHRSMQAKCAKCYQKHSNRIVKRLLYGDNLFAWAINLYVKYHLSHEMIARILKEQFGIWINPMYLVQRKHKWLLRWEEDVAYLWETILKSPVIHIDETSVKLSKDKGYVWAFATPHTVFYHFTYTRESDFLLEWLKGYKGVIVTDSFPGYEKIQVRQQKCLIHIIRDLNDDLFKNPFDDEYKHLVSTFGKLLRSIIETIDRYGLKKRHLQKHLKDISRFYEHHLCQEYKSALSTQYVKRLRKHWEELWTFLVCDGVPWNNNNAEAAIKAFAQHRRGVNGQISEKGLRDYLKMLSLAQTCRYRNISFLSLLRKKTGLWENMAEEAMPGYLPFSQAKVYVHRLGFERKQEWVAWYKAGRCPSFIPHSPHIVYKKHGWAGWHDWLGFDFLPFKEARTHMRKLRLRNRDDYWAWQKSGKRPRNIPACPEKIYKYTGWSGLGDWLGTGNLGRQKKAKMSYQQAKAYVQAIGITTQHDFFRWRTSGQKPETIPSAPNESYPEFQSWGEFLGTDRVANQRKKYRTYWEAKEFLAPLAITSARHFKELYRSGTIPADIPRSPYTYYCKRGTWQSFTDFWGKEH